MADVGGVWVTSEKKGGVEQKGYIYTYSMRSVTLSQVGCGIKTKERLYTKYRV